MPLRMIMSKDLAVRIGAVLGSMVDEALIAFTPEGLRIKAVDNAHIAMVELNVDKGAFESFSSDDREIGIDLERYSEFLKIASAGDLVHLSLDEGSGKWVMVIGNVTRSMAPLSTKDWPSVKIPKLALEAKAILNSEELHRIVKATAGTAGGTFHGLGISIDPDFISMDANGDTDSVSMRLAKDLLVSLECQTHVCSKLPLDYIGNIAKAIPNGTLITMRLGDDLPLRLDFPIAEGKGQVSYYLAPLLEED